MAVFVLTFILSVAIRVIIIRYTPEYNCSIDLEIYMGSGALVLAGADPYDVDDAPALREELRRAAKSPWLNEDQGRWNYYVTAFLPMVAVLMGLIGYIGRDASTYRVAFAVGDALACAMCCGLMWRVFEKKARWTALAAVVAGCCVSPYFFWYGTVIPEPKGFQIFLMAATMAALASTSRFVVTAVLPCFLGLSISYYGLGIFFVPPAVVKVWRCSPDRVVDCSVFCAVLSVATLPWLLPFCEGYVEMIRYRLMSSAGKGQPVHANIWRVVQTVVPEHWRAIQAGTLVVWGLVLAGIGLRRLVCGAGVAAMCVFVFVIVFIAGAQGGSMDRPNVGVVMGLIGLTLMSVRAGLVLSVVYAACGAVSWIFGARVVEYLAGMYPRADIDREFLDGMLVLLLTVVYFATSVAILLRRCGAGEKHEEKCANCG